VLGNLRVKDPYTEDAEAQSHAEVASQLGAATHAAQALPAGAGRVAGDARQGAQVLPHASLWKDLRTLPWTGLGSSIRMESSGVLGVRVLYPKTPNLQIQMSRYRFFDLLVPRTALKGIGIRR